MVLYEARRAIVEGVTSVAVRASGLKVSWREAEAWHHVVGSESMKTGQKTENIGEGTVQLQESL